MGWGSRAWGCVKVKKGRLVRKRGGGETKSEDGLFGLFIACSSSGAGGAGGGGGRGPRGEGGKKRATLRAGVGRVMFGCVGSFVWDWSGTFVWWQRERGGRGGSGGAATSQRATRREKRGGRKRDTGARERAVISPPPLLHPRCLLSRSCCCWMRLMSSGSSLRAVSATGTAVPPPPQLRQGLRPVPEQVRQPTSRSLQRTQAHSSLPVPPHVTQSRLPPRLGSCELGVWMVIRGGVIGEVGFWRGEGGVRGEGREKRLAPDARAKKRAVADQIGAVAADSLPRQQETQTHRLGMGDGPRGRGGQAQLDEHRRGAGLARDGAAARGGREQRRGGGERGRGEGDEGGRGRCRRVGQAERATSRRGARGAAEGGHREDGGPEGGVNAPGLRRVRKKRERVFRVVAGALVGSPLGLARLVLDEVGVCMV